MNKITQMIVAVDEAGCIGLNNSLPPWKVKGDLKRFRMLTMATTCIMGRTTYDDIVNLTGNYLEGRRNIVITSRKLKVPDNGAVIPVSSFEEAIAKARYMPSDKISFIGGRSVFTDAIEKANVQHVYLTIAKGIYPCTARLDIIEHMPKLGYVLEHEEQADDGSGVFQNWRKQDLFGG